MIYLGGYNADGGAIGSSYVYSYSGRHAWAQMVSDWWHGYDGSRHGRRATTIHELGRLMPTMRMLVAISRHTIGGVGWIITTR